MQAELNARRVRLAEATEIRNVISIVNRSAEHRVQFHYRPMSHRMGSNEQATFESTSRIPAGQTQLNGESEPVVPVYAYRTAP